MCENKKMIFFNCCMSKQVKRPGNYVKIVARKFREGVIDEFNERVEDSKAKFTNDVRGKVSKILRKQFTKFVEEMDKSQISPDIDEIWKTYNRCINSEGWYDGDRIIMTKKEYNDLFTETMREKFLEAIKSIYEYFNDDMPKTRDKLKTKSSMKFGVNLSGEDDMTDKDIGWFDLNCLICKCKFESKMDLREHLREEKHYAEECMKEIQTEYDATMEQLEKLGDSEDNRKLVCPVSYRLLNEPISLICGHTFNRSSIIKHMENAKSKDGEKPKSHCPVCKTELDIELVKSIKINTLIREMLPKEYYDLIKKCEDIRNCISRFNQFLYLKMEKYKKMQEKFYDLSNTIAQ